MFRTTELNQFFPTCVWVHKVAQPESLNPALAREITGLRERDPGGGDRPSGWQSRADLHGLDAFRPLTGLILAASKGVLDFLACRYERFEITNCWANVNLLGQSHRDHMHPNNYLSGVYYVQVPPGSGRIVFRDPRPQAMVFVPDVHKRTAFNSDQHGITPEPGDLILFHSWLSHMVEPSRSEEPRISIAFNVALRGIVGIELAGAVL